MGVRALVESDLPQVADLHWRFLRNRHGSAPPSLHSLLRELYFDSPFVDPAIPSLVYESQAGDVVGFAGGTVRKMSFRGEPVRVIFAGNFVIHPGFRSGLAAPRIVTSFLHAQNDLALVESANDVSRRILESVGSLIPALNYHWRRPLRPIRYGMYAISHSVPPALSSALNLAAKPFCSLADTIAEKLPASPFRFSKSALVASEADVETLLQCFVEFRKSYSLWPEYDAASLRWLLNYMERSRAHGQLRKLVLRNEEEKIVGWYIYYVKPRAIGQVVQIGGDPKFTKDVLDHLFMDAWEHGVIALHGVVDSRRLPDFSDKGCIFNCRGGWALARSSNSELLKALERGDGFLSRLDGEWCLDPGE